MGLTTPPCKNIHVRRPTNSPRNGNDLNGQRPGNCKRQRIRKMDINIATWNIRTMLQTGKMMEIAGEIKKYSIDIAAIQEIRWQGSGRVDKKDFSMLYSGHQDRTGMNGTGFMVSSKIRKSILGFVPVNDRICKIRLKGRFRNITMISAYAPTEDKDIEIKETFYDNLMRECNNVPKYDLIIIMGDFNAKIGKEDFVSSVAGKYTLHEETNENGKLLCQMAMAQSLVVRSTCFNHKNVHKGTWKVPGTEQLNQIDHILSSYRHAKSIIDVRSCRGPNCDSDHYLVKAVLRERISNTLKEEANVRTKWDTGKLKNETEASKFERIVREKMENEEEVEDISERWKKIERALVEAAKETIGTKKREKREGWFDEECRRAIEKKNTERDKLLQRKTRQKWEKYSESRREAKRVLKKKKREYLRRQVEDLQQMKNRNETRYFYQRVNHLKNGYQPKLNLCKNKEGEILSEEKEIMDRWTEYFRELLNKEPTINEEVEIPDDNVNVDEPTLREVELVVKAMKNNKAPGKDSIVVELLKYGGKTIIRELHKLICKIWENEEMPEDWKVGIICPIFKKGDRLQCSNYRGITLLSVAYKIFATLAQRRLNEYAEKILEEYQCGFRPGRSTVDQMFVMRQIMEKCYEYGTPLHILFIDFKQAFDSIDRNELYKALIEVNIPRKLVRLIKVTLTNAKAAVMVSGKIGSEFHIESGVKQGDSLSSTLFNLVLHAAVSKLKLKGSVINKLKQMCAYADDIALVARTKRALNETFVDLERECNKVGLFINIDKTKYMRMASEDVRVVENEIDIGGHNFGAVPSFKYLGAILSHNNKVSDEINSRIMAGNRAYFAQIKLIKSKLLYRQTKIHLYKTLIRPIVTYGSETWTMTDADVNALRVFERKIYRRIYGPIKEGEVWRLRRNDEINGVIGNEDIVRFIKASRLRWIGHVERMDQERIQRRIMNSQIMGVRKRGRPRKRWVQDVEEDLRKMGIRRWKIEAQNRDGWRRIAREAKAHIGL